MANTTAIKNKIDEKFDELISEPQSAGSSGSIWFVDSNNGSSSNQGNRATNAFASIATAIAALTGDDDTIVLLPGHAETVDTLITVDHGVKIIGLGIGRNRPTFTHDGSTAIDIMTITADNVLIENIRFVGAASCTALLNIAESDVHIKNCVFESGAAPVDVITVASGHRGIIEHCLFLGTAAGADNAIMFQAGSGSCSNWRISDCIFNYLQYDIDENIIDIPADAHPGLIIERCQMLGLAVGALTIKSSVANQFGAMIDCHLVAHAAVTIAELVGTTIEGMFFSNVRATDVTKTERSIEIPATTPA